MLNKKLLTILILIAVIFSVSAASAMDAGNGTLEVSDDAIDVDDSISSLNNDIYDDYLKANISDFDDLSDKVNGTEDGETLYLESDYRTTNSSNQIIISKSITIDGQNHVIEAPDVKRVFLIEANDVCIRNINFINSKATGLAGGVISWLGDNGTLENCNFTNNSASSGGGAVCWIGDFGRISNCSFQSNDVKFGPAVGLTCQDSFDPHMIHIKIVNSEGGALYIGGNDVSVDFCRFYNNVALLNGGAISVNWGNNVSISNSKFRNNTAGYNGGAIDFNGNNASLANLKFIRNSPKDLFLNSINATVANTSFKDESAVESWYDVNYVNVTYGIGDFEILSDEIYMTPEGGILVLDRDYEFVNGSAEGIVISKSITIDGAGHTLNGNKLSRIFNVTADNVTIKNVNFINGDSRGSYYIYYGGGAILWNGNDGCVENCSFEDNCEYSIDIEEFRQEIVVCDDGVMHIEYYYILPVVGATTSQGGAIAWIGDNGKVENSTFRRNSVGYANDGGAIYWAGVNGKIINSQFYDNDAFRGAALYWSGVNGTVSLSTFINSGICDDGIFWTGQNGLIKNSILLSELGFNCVISQYSNGVKADFNFWGDTIDSPNRANKSANVNFWVLMDYIASTDFVFEGDFIDVNYKFDRVMDKSNNIYSFSGMASKAGNVSFTSNETGIVNVSYGKYNATGIFNGSYGRNDFTLNVIPYNSSGDFYDLLIKIHDTPEGGVLVLDRNYEFATGYNKGILISKSIVIDGAGHTLNGNKLSRIFNITADNVTIKNVNFINGNAYGRYFAKVVGGGAIYWSGDNGYLFNCSFVRNSGSGIEDDPFELEGIGIDDNGMIWCITRMRVAGAKTNEGGAIVWNGTNGTVNKCIFKYNGVGYPNPGGAICWRGDFGKVIESEFVSNDAWSGSAICWDGEYGSISSSSFEGNTFGSAIMWFAKTGIISDSILLDSMRTPLYIYGGNVTAENNWWGDILDDFNLILRPNSVSNWLVLNYTADKSIVYAGEEVTVEFNFGYLANASCIIGKYDADSINVKLYFDNGDAVDFVNGTGRYKFNAPSTGKISGILIENGKIRINIKPLAKIISSDMSKFYKASKQFKVRVYGVDGKVAASKKVKFTINKKVYYANTDKNGYASLKINLKPGTYSVTTQYEDINVKNKIVVKSFLITKDISKKVKSSAKFYVKVLKTNGKVYPKRTVQIKFLGKTYKIITNSKGIAAFTVPKNLKVGKYAIKSTFNGITNTNKIIVKK